MKISKDAKYLTCVSGMGNPDKTLSYERLHILEINEDECSAFFHQRDFK